MSSPYVRLFDWDEARRRHAAGERYTVIARDLGVTYSAVRRVCDPTVRVRMQAAIDRYQKSGVCRDCGKLGVTPRNGRCQKCAGLARATSVRPDTLHCNSCDEWKPDVDFPGNRTETARRGRHGLCRSCLTAAKARWRERYPEKYEATKRRDWENRKRRMRAAP